MQEHDFPALYRSANDLSLASQKNFFFILRSHLIALVTAATLSIISTPHWSIAALQLLSLLYALGCSIYLFLMRPDKSWYAGRSIAESIKTITWRYVCRAEPFQDCDSKARSNFLKKLKSIIEQNQEACQNFTQHLDGVQITNTMDIIRSKNLTSRKKNYADHRILDQLTWYSQKATYNRQKSKKFFLTLIIINFIAVAFSAIRIAHPDQSLWPTDVFVAAAASIISWMQANRFSELSASYALAAHEISFIKEQSLLPESEEEFSIFVGDSENAFSREHTQWVARKDI